MSLAARLERLPPRADLLTLQRRVRERLAAGAAERGNEGDWLTAEALACRHDPLRYVTLAYPWGVPGGPLERHPGPDGWQSETLAYVRDHVGIGKPVRVAVAGGVGPGKTAVMAWLIDWAMVTCPDTRCRITANTGPQLSTATWPELTKWRRMSLWASWFEVGERRIRSADPAHRDTWRADVMTWDAARPEAFAGFHNAGRRIVYAFDEGAGIADSIYRESEGILAGAEDTEIVWLVLGNPTRNSGTFRTLFAGGRLAHLWRSWHIDTRQARMSDKTQIKEWIDSYGLDSDFVRVRVLSQFPKAGSTQFIASDLVDRAMAKETRFEACGTLVMGVDVARFGDDQTVIRLRKGRDARSFPTLKLRGMETMQVAARVAELYQLHQPDAVFVDAGGLGAGVVDRLKYLNIAVRGIDFGGRPDGDMMTANSGIRYANKRAEMWGRMRDWLGAGAMLPDDRELAEELVAVEYGFAMRDGSDAILLERKEDMRKRGLASSDNSDALALTFAHPISVSDDWRLGRGSGDWRAKFARPGRTHESNYVDPLWGGSATSANGPPDDNFPRRGGRPMEI